MWWWVLYSHDTGGDFHRLLPGCSHLASILLSATASLRFLFLLLHLHIIDLHQSFCPFFSLPIFLSLAPISPSWIIIQLVWLDNQTFPRPLQDRVNKKRKESLELVLASSLVKKCGIIWSANDEGGDDVC